MPTPINTELYDKVKLYADSIYEKPSAYKSGFIVKTYKQLGGKYKDNKTPPHLKYWFEERWRSLSNYDQYPVYRPTIRIDNKDHKTPLTVNEIDPIQLKKQIKRKQIIKGKSNLPPFEPL